MHQHFSRTYQQAREHFIKACCDFKGELASIKHPEQGPDVVLALVADQWLHRYGNPASPEAALIKGMMMDAFYPDSDEWRESIVGIARDVVDQALAS
jgi:hypothetical protein